VASHDHSSLSNLIRAAASGDEQSQLKLRKQLEPKLRQWADSDLRELGCHKRELHMEEVAEEARDNIFKGLPNLREPYALFRYSKITVRRGALRHNRRCQKLTSLESLLLRSDDESGEETIPFEPAELRDNDESIIQGRLIDEILYIAETIDPRFPELLKLRFYEGLSWREVAESIDESYGNTRTLYIRWLLELQMKVLTVEEMKRILIEKEKKKKPDNE
jgi:DNA-directed RNA polymerase specialized sigma24 family protein